MRWRCIAQLRIALRSWRNRERVDADKASGWMNGNADAKAAGPIPTMAAPIASSVPNCSAVAVRNSATSMAIRRSLAVSSAKPKSTIRTRPSAPTITFARRDPRWRCGVVQEAICRHDAGDRRESPVGIECVGQCASSGREQDGRVRNLALPRPCATCAGTASHQVTSASSRRLALAS